MATATPPPAPTAAPAERIRQAYAARAETDYLFSFWTAFGWTLLTCGIYGFYVVYHLVKRSRDHNMRRLDMLDAATALAWDRATSEGRADELRPNFERIGVHMGVLRAMTTDFRDPVIWTVLSLIGIVHIILYVLLDQDLVKHDAAERAIEAELSAVYQALGANLPAPTGAPKQPHNYVARVIVAIFTGIYSFWWLYNIMDEGNRHFQENWAWEDSLRHALGG